MIPALGLLAAIAFVPLDDRPVTAQLPRLLGRIAGERVLEPPRALLGRYYTAGSPDAIIAWLNGAPQRRSRAFVLSTDMLAYGGLVASRVPGVEYADAAFRLRVLAHLRRAHPHAWIAAFGTIMRLAPTAAPAGSGFFAAAPAWSYLQEYANLHDPPLATEAARAADLRRRIGLPLLESYLATRYRDYAIDRHLIDLARRGIVDRLVLGQDDAGPVGLHVKEVRALAFAAAGAHVAIEPGADELGMALVAHALARSVGWRPRIAVRYSRPDGGTYQDPIEFAPIADAVDALIRRCGGRRVETNPEIVLAVRVPDTDGAQERAFIASLRADERAGTPVALADLSFLQSYAAQGRFAARILRDGIASRLDAYAGWNTNANTVGTALAEAVAAGVGRRNGRYDALAHRTFTFMRFVDDVAFHVDVRPQLIAQVKAAGVDPAVLHGALLAAVAARNRALLWNAAVPILRQLDPGYHIAAMTIALPWDRTFETKIAVGIAPPP